MTLTVSFVLTIHGHSLQMPRTDLSGSTNRCAPLLPSRLFYSLEAPLLPRTVDWKTEMEQLEPAGQKLWKKIRAATSMSR
jgi:hypothetical protein